MDHPRRTLFPVAPLAAGLLALFLASSLFAQGPPAPAPGEEVGDLVNSLLAGLLGMEEVTETDLQAEVAEAGGVPFKARVPLEYMGRSELKRYVADMFDAEYPAEEAAADARTLRAFDLLPAGTDLRAVRARALEENVVGFYDERPEKRRLYVVSEERKLTPMNQLVLSHELRHALQDQYMHIHDLLADDVSDYDDRSLALLSLLEGDATFVMERFLLQRLPGRAEDLAGLGGDGAGIFGMGAMPAAAVPGAPAVVRDQLVLPYFAGRDFVHALFTQGGWEAVRAAWSRPPESTEQILHPDKYRSRDSPRHVEAPAVPPGSRLLRAGVLGEALLRTWLGEGGETAAAGWGGDAFRCVDVGGRTLLTWRLEWDSGEDAREFQAAARRRLSPARPGPPRADGFEVYARGEWRFGLRERGGRVDVYSSDEGRLFEAALRGREVPAGQ